MFDFTISTASDSGLCEKQRVDATNKANAEYNKRIKREIEAGLFNKYQTELPDHDSNSLTKWLVYAALVQTIVDDIAIKSGELKECSDD